MSLAIQDGRLSKSRHFRMRQTFKKGQFRRIAENFSCDPSAIGPAIRPQTSVTPMVPQMTHAAS